MSHYRLETYTARHAVFSSTWGECLLVDRATLRTVYSQQDQGRASLAEALMIANRGRLDDYAAPLVECCGGHSLTINALMDVRATLDELADLEACSVLAAPKPRNVYRLHH